MIWPFSASSKQQALPAVPTIPTVEQVFDTLSWLKGELLALNFIHDDARDAATRGSLLAALDRFAEVAKSADWTTADGARIAENFDTLCRIVVTNAQGDELIGSFTRTLADSASCYTNPFLVLSSYYKEMKKLPAAGAHFVPPTETSESSATFPDYSAVSEIFHDQFKELAAAWQVRTDQDLSVEDRYLVDALATSYLPESISLYTSLSKDPAFAEQAREMLDQQLPLFAARLATIEDMSAKRQLQAMAAHTAFLEERLRPEPEATEHLSIAR